MGAEAQSATAIVTVPPGLESKVEDTVFQMMSGAVAVLNEAGCALVGGHTGEGRELALGFAINGLIDETLANVMQQGRHAAGRRADPDQADRHRHAVRRARAPAGAGRWIDAALESMQVSNRAAVPCLPAHGATACTDLTGFGLLGHLVEMTRASGVDAELELVALPLLDGAVDTVAAGILSSLQPANVRLRRALRNPGGLRQPPALSACSSIRKPPAACSPACPPKRSRPASLNCVALATRKPSVSAVSWLKAKRWNRYG